MRVTNLRMVVDVGASRGVRTEAITRHLVASSFPAPITLNVRVRYEAVIPAHHSVEASVEAPAGAIIARASSYTDKPVTNHGEATFALVFTAYEAGTYTVRATVSNQDVPPKKVTIRHAAL
jgi:hypothetical protein